MRIKSEKVWINEELTPQVVEFENGRIVSILDYSEEADVDYGNLMILPGFIDIHTHGYGGADASIPDFEGLQKWANNMPNEGVTSFLATIDSQPYEANMNAFKVISKFMDEQKAGSEVLGINVEGNFICEQYKGCQDIDSIVPPEIKVIDDYIKASNNTIKTVICAVEKDENNIFVKHVVGKGIAVSVGHTNATYAETVKAIEAGITGVTHTGNGMRPIHHREPGVFGAALNRPELYAEMICDGIHLHFEMVNIIGTQKGKDKLILITDSTPYKDFQGTIETNKLTVNSDGSIRNSAGNLAGSMLKYNLGVFNALYEARLPLVSVINGATINPAKYLGVDDKKGTIEVSKDADIIVVDDKFDIKEVFLKGSKFFN